MCTPGRRLLCESPEEFSCLQPVGPDSRGSKEELSSSSPIISLACWCDFPGPFFLSVSTVTWAGRKLARVSDNCVRGSRKRGGKEAGQHRPAPPAGRRPPLPTWPRGTRVRVGVEALAGHRGVSSLMYQRKSRSLVLVKENTALAMGHLMSREPPAWLLPLPGRPGRVLSGPPGPTTVPRGSTLSPTPAEPGGPGGCGLFIFNFTRISSREGTFPVTPLAGTAAEAETPKEMSPASAHKRAPCSPTPRRAAIKGVSRAWPQGPPAARTRAMEADSLGPAPGSAAKGSIFSPPEQACQVKYLGHTYTKIFSWASCIFLCSSGSDICRVRPKFSQLRKATVCPVATSVLSATASLWLSRTRLGPTLSL